MKTAERVALVEGDVSPEFEWAARDAKLIAWDIETSGLDWRADRLATCQLHIDGFGTQVIRVYRDIPVRLRELLMSERVVKVFHHAPFDLRFMGHHWNATPRGVACTKIASKILRPKVDSSEHSLKPVLRHYLGVDIAKGQQTSNWLAHDLSEAQVTYAAEDVQYLLPLFAEQMEQARAQGVADILDRTFEYIPTRVETDLLGCGDVFAY